MISGTKNLAGAIVLAALLVSSVAAHATPPVYYVSMRGLLTETAPTFVLVVRQAAGERTVVIAGCDGHSYYATPADAASVSAARTNGDIVQLHRGAQGGAPENSAIKCIIDASGD